MEYTGPTMLRQIEGAWTDCYRGASPSFQSIFILSAIILPDNVTLLLCVVKPKTKCSSKSWDWFPPCTLSPLGWGGSEKQKWVTFHQDVRQDSGEIQQTVTMRMRIALKDYSKLRVIMKRKTYLDSIKRSYLIQRRQKPVQMIPKLQLMCTSSQIHALLLYSIKDKSQHELDLYKGGENDLN